MLIESRNNEKIKQAVSLCESAKQRKESGLFFLEGMRLCSDAAKTGIGIKRLFYLSSAVQNERFDKIAGCARECYEITPWVADRLAQTKSTQGIFAVCEIPKNRLSVTELTQGGCYIALENVQDPANLGTVCRTAEALGIRGAVLCGCCDAYNPKAQRAAMGSLLRLPTLITDDIIQIVKKVQQAKTPVFAAVPDERAEKITAVDFKNGAVVIIGNEGNGVTPACKELCRLLTIPMKGRAESLNASAAASIVMWEMMRQ